MVEIKSEENNTVQVPNNICQVIYPGKNKNIEDYVMTYLNQMTGEKPALQKQHFFLEKRSKRRVRIFTLSVRQLL